MSAAPLLEKVDAILGRPFDEVPCYRMLEMLSPRWPPSGGVEVDKEHLVPGDFVAFGDPPRTVDSPVGVYIGNGKVVASIEGHGVLLVPWRWVKERFMWGVRADG